MASTGDEHRATAYEDVAVALDALRFSPVDLSAAGQFRAASARARLWASTGTRDALVETQNVVGRLLLVAANNPAGSLPVREAQAALQRAADETEVRMRGDLRG